MEYQGKILFLKTRWADGGIERVVVQVARLLKELGYSPVVATGDFTANSLRPHDLPMIELGTYYPLKWRNLAAFVVSIPRFGASLLRLTKELHPEVLICLDVSSAWVSFLLGCRPTVLWVHGSIGAFWARFSKWRLHRLLLRRIDALIVLNEQMKREALELIGDQREPRTVIINNPMTADFQGILYCPRARRLVYVGRLDQDKRVDRLLRALGLLKWFEWELWVFGDGAESEKLVDLAARIGISDRVRFMGWSKDPWRDIADAGGAKALVLTSDSEGHGQVLVEAMYHGLPCVSVDCPVGPREIIIDGLNGFLVPLRDEEKTISELAEKIRAVLDKNDFDPQSIRSSVERYMPANVVRQWEEFLRKLTSDKAIRQRLTTR